MSINKVYVSEVPPIVLKNPGRDGTSGTSGVSGTSGNSFIGVVPNYTSSPTPESGSLYFNTTDSHFYGWNGEQWKQLDN